MATSRFVWGVLGLLICSLCPVVQAQDAARADLDFFENRVRPLLVERCLSCHGPKKSEAGLRLDQREHLLAGGDSGAAIVPGEPQQSLLIEAVQYEGDLEMPPDEKLADTDIEALQRWIRNGAIWPADLKLGGDGPALRGGPITTSEQAFWAYQLPRAVPVPTVATSTLVKNEVDQFIAATLETHGLTMRQPASKRELLRRATFDLTGLPPTPADMAAFLADDSPQAFARVIDRLLESPAYGERWGRHWLDVVRYADTAGETADYPTPLAYKYRNWVVQALNDDLPYDEFLRLQLAGDILARQQFGGPENRLSDEQLEAYRDMMTATGFIAISRRFGFDVENYHHLTIQDTIDTVGQAVLGLTLGCARCHDHKYDPVNMADYYAWYGIFESTRYSFPGSEEKKRPYDLVPDVPPTIAAERQLEFDQQLARLNESLAALESERESLAERLAAVPGAKRFNGFEGEVVGESPSDTWGPLGAMTTSLDAQSPFENVFPAGSRGISSPTNGDNNAIGCSLEPSHTPQASPLLFYNIDFRNRELAAGSQGAYRFYLGRGPGHSAAVEMGANGTTFFVKNGGEYEPICELQPGQWYNLQVRLDLRSKTFAGTIGHPDSLVEFEGKRFTDGWDGLIDYTFVDRYGPFGGATPARDLDNLAVATSPFLPVTVKAAEQPHRQLLSRWQAYIESRRLLANGENQDGHSGFDVWHADPLPMVGASRAAEPLMVPGTVAPGAIVVHPQEQEGVGIGWRSPVTGQVRIRGNVKDAHDCGDSIDWFLDRLGMAGLAPLAQGAIAQNGQQSFLDAAEGRLDEIDVREGEWIQLVVMPKSHYGCDLTQIDLTIEQVDGGQVWNLGSDVKDNLLEGNPHSDSYGHGATWFFYQVEVDRGQAFGKIDVHALAAVDFEQLQSQIESLTRQIDALSTQRNELQQQPPFEQIYGAVDRDQAVDVPIQLRGEKSRPGEIAARRNLEILGGEPLADPSQSGRLDLAQWLASPANPLTARVMVNRIWQHHFGRGIVGTENDFGTRGEPPTHPELLDWLAQQFVASGWSIKQMHRLIMNSAAYQQASEYDAQAAELDPEARWHWRFNRRRLSAEEIRDAMLLVSGELDPTPGGAHPFPAVETWSFSQHAPYYGVYPTNRRSLYLMQQRLKRHPFLSLFDGADTNASTARRAMTTVPTQALFLMNDEFVHRCAAALAGKLMDSQHGDEDRIRLAFETTLGRPADAEEEAATLEFLTRYQQALSEGDADHRARAAWAAVSRGLLTRNEFLFVD